MFGRGDCSELGGAGSLFVGYLVDDADDGRVVMKKEEHEFLVKAGTHHMNSEGLIKMILRQRRELKRIRRLLGAYFTVLVVVAILTVLGWL